VPLLRLDTAEFSSGRAKFRDVPPVSPNRSPRIYIRISVEGLVEPISALLDTGAEFSVLAREVAEEAGLRIADGEQITISHRLGLTAGRLIRTTVRMLADEGDDLLVDATVFVPEGDWPAGKNFIGYVGLLERVKLGLDPQENDLYFGGYQA
jgi:8-oxo-dGTP pyrophosphatase MutT (NUDIX family)